tara:strand:- start:1048 stop:1734 length:687 start_codon:yes stop_codon:yes gene_type:complete
MKSVIELKSVSKTYGRGETKVEAVVDASLKIHEGDFAAIVGPSGSGKSTLLHLIGGLDVASSGEILLAEKRLSQISGKDLSEFRRDHIGFVFQSFNLIPVLTVAENVEYVLLLQGKSAAERRRRVQAMLEELGLADKMHRRPAELSGGQQQRVAVARAMVSEPSIILADEPTANLDSKMALELVTMMKNLNQSEGRTFLFSTHDKTIMKVANRVITLQDGKVKSDDHS